MGRERMSGPYASPNPKRYGWRRISAGRYETTNLRIEHTDMSDGHVWWIVWRKDNDRLIGRETHLKRAKRLAVNTEHLKALQDKRDEAGQ
jgi:hypothetical protein